MAKSQNCTTYGDPDESKFNKPLPLIGLYVAGASLACGIGMAIDLYRILPYRINRISSRLFSLNATTLTLLAVATKISTDIGTPMPGIIDQFAKISPVMLISIAMIHVMPSLGTMSELQLLSNVLALGILVLTIFANLWIQIRTGLVNGFVSYNIISSIVLMLVFGFFVSGALATNNTKKILQKRFEEANTILLDDYSRESFSVERLQGYVEKYWVMALTSSPEYVMLNSGVSEVIVLGPSLLHFATILKSFESVVTDCNEMNSNYKWSINIIYYTQIVAFVSGNAAYLIRYWNFKRMGNFTSWRDVTRIRWHSSPVFSQWKETPIGIANMSKFTRKVVHQTRNLILHIVFAIHFVTMFFCSACLMLMLWIRDMSFNPVVVWFQKLKNCGNSSDVHGDEAVVESLSNYVLHINGEERILPPKQIVRYWRKFPVKWVRTGRKRQPQHLVDLVRNQDITITDGHFFSALDVTKSWFMSLVILTTIDMVLVRDCSLKDARIGIKEGLKYAKFVDKSLDDGQTIKLLYAAEMAWEQVEIYGKWLDVDLNKLWSRECSVVERLGDVCNDVTRTSFCEWKVVSAKCMKDMTTTMRMYCSGTEGETELREYIKNAITQVLWKCLSNLPVAMLAKCSRGTFQEREEGVKEAASVLGETEEILKCYKNMIK